MTGERRPDADPRRLLSLLREVGEGRPDARKRLSEVFVLADLLDLDRRWEIRPRRIGPAAVPPGGEG